MCWASPGRASLAGEAENRGWSDGLGRGSRRGAAFDIERFDRPRDNMERVGACGPRSEPAWRRRGRSSQLYPPKWWVSSAARFGAELIEEHFQRRIVAAQVPAHTSRPRVVINHDDQIAVSTLVGDLIDPDPA